MEKPNKPLVSVVIFCWNRRDDLKLTLSKLREQKTYPNLEIIVVDNASKDGTSDMIKNEFPEVNYTLLEKNISIGAGNIGFDKTRGRYILILDDDSHPAPGAINQAVAEFEQDPQLGILAFNIHDPDTGLAVPRAHRPETDIPVESYTFTGCGALIRKDIFKEVGYYPANYFLYQNELQPSVRILNRGYKIKYYPKIVAYHKFSPKNRATKREIFYGTRNNLLFIWTHLSFFKALRTGWGITFIYGIRALKSFLIWDYLKAHLSVLARLPWMIKNRERLKPEVIQMMKPYFQEHSAINFIKRHA